MAFTATVLASLETQPVWNAGKAPLLSVGFSASAGAVQGAQGGTWQCSSLLHGPTLGIRGPPAAPGAAVGAATATTRVPSAGSAHSLASVLQGVP